MFTPRDQSPAAAIALMLLASLFFAAATLLAKSLGTDALGGPLHPLQVSHGRFLFAFAMISIVVSVARPPIRSTNLRLHFARSLFGWMV